MHLDDADRLPVVVRFPAGPQVSLKCGDQSKDNGAGHKKRAALCTSCMVDSYWLTIALKYLHARTAALLVFGPSSG